MITIKVSTLIKADKNKVYDVIKDMESFPKFMRNVKDVKIIKRQRNKIITEWKTDIGGVPIEWIEEDTFDDKKMSCKFKAIEGDYRYKGQWKLDEDGKGKTVISIVAYFDWEVPNFEKFVGHILEKNAYNSLRSMLNAIKRKSENG